MRTTALCKLPLLLATACAALGCDGEIRPPKALPGSAPPGVGIDPTGQPSPSAPSTGAPAPTPGGDQRLIGGLSSGELVDICHTSHDNLARALAAQVRIECTASSIGQSSDACEDAREKCVNDNMPEAEDEAGDCEMEATTLAQDCATVSVSALRTCEEAWIRKLEGAMEQLDCGSSLEQIREMSDPGAPSECQNVDTRCSAQ